MKGKFNLTTIMIGSTKPKELANFYEKVFARKPDWSDEGWYGWKVGNLNIAIGEHSEMKGQAKDPGRMMLNLETEEVKAEFERVKGEGAKVIAEPYEMEGMWISTLADPDGNYFQIVTPMKDM